LHLANALSYNASGLITAVKVFIVHAPGMKYKEEKTLSRQLKVKEASNQQPAQQLETGGLYYKTFLR
jgi:hypothetical protein